MIPCVKCGKLLPYSAESCDQCGYRFPQVDVGKPLRFGDAYSTWGDIAILVAGILCIVGGVIGIIVGFFVIFRNGVLAGALVLVQSLALTGVGVGMFRLMDVIRHLRRKGGE